MDSREVLRWNWPEDLRAQLEQNVPHLTIFDDITAPAQNAVVEEIVPAVILAPTGQHAVVEEIAPAEPSVILASTAQNALVEEAGAPAGGDPVSPQTLSITTQKALDLDIILAGRPRAPEDEEEVIQSYISDDEDGDEDRGEDTNPLNKESQITAPQLQPPSENHTILRVIRHEDQVARPQELAHEADLLNQALILGEDQLVGTQTGALDTANLSAHMTPALSTTTLQQYQVMQPRAVDVSRINSLELPKNELPENDVHGIAFISLTNSETDFLMEVDDASSKLQQEVGRASGTGPRIANPALHVKAIILAGKAVRSEDAAETSHDPEMISTTRLVTSMDPVHCQEGSITSLASQKKQVTSSESSSSFTASSSSTS